jgi:hypothetical protein
VFEKGAEFEFLKVLQAQRPVGFAVVIDGGVTAGTKAPCVEGL